jgi:hypothetical protein
MDPRTHHRSNVEREASEAAGRVQARAPMMLGGLTVFAAAAPTLEAGEERMTRIGDGRKARNVFHLSAFARPPRPAGCAA